MALVRRLMRWNVLAYSLVWLSESGRFWQVHFCVHATCGVL